MSDFISGLMLTAVLFGFSFGTVFICKFFYLYRKYLKNETPPEDVPSSEAKIYYITNTVKQKRRAKRQRKEPNIALKGALINPEEFKKICSEKELID